jgi:hypothetical protein
MQVNANVRPVETVPGMWRGIKEDGGGGDSRVTYLIHCKRFCKCHKAPHPAQQ